MGGRHQEARTPGTVDRPVLATNINLALESSVSPLPSYLLVIKVNVPTVDRKEGVCQRPSQAVEGIVVTMSSPLEPGQGSITRAQQQDSTHLISM